MSRRQFLASTAACAAGAMLPLSTSVRAFAGSPTIIRAEKRVIEVAGKAADVFGLVQPDGTHGLFLQAGEDFDVRLENHLDEPTLLHWHGLTPPFGQDGVPDMPQPLLEAGASYDYRFPVDRGGTHFMHAHTLQEQRLLAAPLIVRDVQEASADEQDVVVLLHDFSFRSPEELLSGLTGMSGGMAGHGGGHGGHGGGHGGMAPDLNDIEYDAYLANDRTLDDPQSFQVERGGTVRLRLINGASATAFWIDLGALQGEAIAVDGNPVTPVAGKRFPLGMGQRIDIRLRLPRQEGAWPILALREGARERTGFYLATAGGAVKRIASLGEEAPGALDLAIEESLQGENPLEEVAAARSEQVPLGGSMDGYTWTLGGAAWGTHRVLEVGEGERVEFVMRNESVMGHPMHLHGHRFQVVAIDGRRFSGALRDTVWVPPEREVTIAFDADNPGEWAFHCHHLYHMAAGMMTIVRYS
ncbi:multicopper oxidase family protein [Chelativorans sp. EGI FJ00035]|uniref:Multicopper oxidase family protein n=1 Tax=Chelativorans salis TaxID=2978478 RepID=A0ABT2LKH7_9HYPH|nr:multicopper oxidase family protein [Chelativorans sp. EGI FJ00035]